jgi:hypothetical protein
MPSSIKAAQLVKSATPGEGSRKKVVNADIAYFTP